MRAQHRTFNKAIKGLVWFEMISFVTFRLYLKRSSDCLMIFNYMRLSGAHNRGGGGLGLDCKIAKSRSKIHSKL